MTEKMANKSKKGAKSRAWPANSVELRAIGDLVPFEHNARTHSDAQIGQIAASIEAWGWTNPVLIDAAGTIIAGHGRVLAAEKLAIDQVPCMIADDWTEEQVRAYCLADNKLAENAGWDRVTLADELFGLEARGFDVALIGFSEEEMDALKPTKGAGLTDPDAVPEMRPDPVTRSRDVWILGDHKLICGDAIAIGDLDAIMAGALADAAWTDPPIKVEAAKDGDGEAAALHEDELTAFLLDAFAGVFACLKDGAAAYVAHEDAHGLAVRGAFVSAGFKLQTSLVWIQGEPRKTKGDYWSQHSPILYGHKPGRRRWFGDRKTSTIRGQDGTPFTKNEDGSISVRIGEDVLIIRGKGLEAEPIEPTTIAVPLPRGSGHAQAKPVDLVRKTLRNSTGRGDVILDPFAGSGATIIAAEMEGLHGRAIEEDPRLCDVIVRRWQNFTGRQATLEADGSSFDARDAARQGGGGD